MTQPVFPPFRSGDPVTLTTIDADSINAMVILASSNGRSLVLKFDGIIDGHCGMMPVLDEDDGGGFCSVISGIQVFVTPRVD